MNHNHDIIVSYIKEILETLRIPFVSIGYYYDEEINMILFSIETPESHFFLDKGAEALRAFDMIIRKIVEKKYPDQSPFMVDINDFQKKRITSIKTKAKIVADRAIAFKKDIALDPMPPYERLMVHTFLKNIDSVTTESVGESKERHIVVKYNEMISETI